NDANVFSDAEFFDDGKFFLVLTDESELAAGALENLHDEKTKAAITEDSDTGAFFDGHLAQDLESGGERFGENSLFVGDMIGDGVKIAGGQAQVFREGAIAILDSEHGALNAVR